MKILHLLGTNQFSGAENVICQIIGMFKNDPETEMVYCSPDGQIREALDERCIRFAPIRDLSVKEVKRVIREEKPDAIHAHDMRASLIGALACKKLPLFSHIHVNNFDSRGLSLKSIAFLPAAIKAKHIFWVSPSSYKGYFFHGLFKKKSSVLQNIINVEALYQKMQQDTTHYTYDIVYVGRLSYQKDPERLVGVLSKVCEKKANIKIAIVGAGDMEEVTKKAVHERGLEGNIEFLGFCSNPLKILHDAKAMIMTSRWEGTPMCALEALALGTPVVSTPADGLCDLIQNDTNGFLSNSDDELAEKLLYLVTNDEAQKRLSESAASISQQYNSIAEYKKQVELVYATIPRGEK